MNLVKFSFRDEALQRFLWNYLNPQDIRWDYTIMDAMKEVEASWNVGETVFYGDLSKHLVFRVAQHNPAVACPHIMGNGRYIRDGLRHGLPLLWAEGFKAVQVWTSHENIARIVTKFGFTLVGIIPDLYMDKEHHVHPMYVLNLDRRDQSDQGDDDGRQE